MNKRFNARWFPIATAVVLTTVALFTTGCHTLSIDVFGLTTCDILNCDSLFFLDAASADPNNEIKDKTNEEGHLLAS